MLLLAKSGDVVDLASLAEKYGTDKGRDRHDYVRVYPLHMPDRSDGFTLLEIGVASGASLRMWREYFPNARIIGVDIDPRCAEHIDDDIEIYITKQSELNQFPLFLDRHIGTLDVVIDDGSHRWSDQITSFLTLWPRLSPGGVYVIEDLHTSYDASYGAAHHITAMEFLQHKIDEMNLSGTGSGLGSLQNETRFNPQLLPLLSEFQKTVESMTFYKSMVFIHKRGDEIV